MQLFDRLCQLLTFHNSIPRNLLTIYGYVIKYRQVNFFHLTAGSGTERNLFMKKLMLSTPALRVCCLAGDAVLLALALAWQLLAFSWLSALAGLSALALMGLYTALVFRSAAWPDPARHTLVLTGIQNRADDLTGARVVYTRPAQTGPLAARAIVIEDGGGRELSVIATLITVNQGYPCERLARELAEALGIPFRPTVPAHLYDRKAKKEYLRAQKERARVEAAEKPAAVNYDEQDDEK